MGRLFITISRKPKWGNDHQLSIPNPTQPEELENPREAGSMLGSELSQQQSDCPGASHLTLWAFIFSFISLEPHWINSKFPLKCNNP